MYKNCLICNSKFIPFTNSLYCSDYCRGKNYQEKNFKRFNYELLRVRIFERDNFKCIYCGLTSIEDGIKLNLEHIIPRSQGGNNAVDNLITSCEDCNKHKGGYLFKTKTYNRIQKVINKRNMLYFTDKEKEIIQKGINETYKPKKLFMIGCITL